MHPIASFYVFFEQPMTDFTRLFLSWYTAGKRNLPWRHTKDPYAVWVSEIILQQTRVEQGLAYYHRFLNRFPDVGSLASASENEVLEVWKGLGYYSRARNMHSSARHVMQYLNGNFPADYATLRTLRGVGDYTASAIASICNNESTPVVDGNVVRVISRIFGIGLPAGTSALQAEIKRRMQAMIPVSEPGDFNQAVMEFGATHCKPSSPDCKTCMFSAHCVAFTTGRISDFPPRRKEVIKRNRYFTYMCLLTPDKQLLLRKRKSNDIWKSLWEFPLAEADALLVTDDLLNHPEIVRFGASAKVSRFFDYRHLLTHQTIYARFILFSIQNTEVAMTGNEVFYPIQEVKSTLPVPRLIGRFLDEASGVIF